MQFYYKAKDLVKLEHILNFFKNLSLYKDSSIHIIRITGNFYKY